MTRLQIVFLLLLGLLSLGSAVAQSAVIKPGHSLQVVCLEEPSLSKTYTVTADGYAVMQFIGAISLAGLSEKEAANKIAATLIEQRILPRASVTVKVLGSSPAGLIGFSGAVTRSGEMFPAKGIRLSDVVKECRPTAAADLERVRIVTADGKTLLVNFTLYDGKVNTNNPELRAGDRVIFDLLTTNADIQVLGLVRKPGAIPFEPGLTIKRAISSAGGLNVLADAKRIRWEREGVAPSVVSSDSGDVLKPGDRLFVPEMPPIGTVTVGGQVANPGTISLREGMTVVDVIRAAGGPKKSADLKHVKLHRKGIAKGDVIDVDLNAVAMGGGADPKVQPLDRVDVVGIRKRGFDLKSIVGVALIGVFFGVVKF